MGSELLLHTRQQIGDYHVVIVKLQAVTSDSVRPDGFKLNCVLLDFRVNKAVLILDNHEPFGYHLHPTPIDDHGNREKIEVQSPFEAIDLFVEMSQEIANEK